MKNPYIDYLTKISEAYFQAFKKVLKLKNRNEYVECCKKRNKDYNSKDFNIEKNHELEEYFDKYRKTFEKGRASAFTSDQLFIMKTKSKYWEIPNETDLLYFEIPSFNRRHPLFFFWLIFGVAVVGAGTYGIYYHLKPGPGPQPTIYEAEINEDPHSSFVVEGGGSLSNHKPGDTIEITFEAKGEAETGYKYGLPLDIGEGLSVENAADAKYKFDEETGKGKLFVTFGEHDININFAALKYCISEDIDCIEEYNSEGDYVDTLSVSEFRDAIVPPDYVANAENTYMFPGYTFILQKDLDIDNFEPFADTFADPNRNSIYFGGMFDGNHKTMKIANNNMEVWDGGLFAAVSSGQKDVYAGVKNLNLYVDLTSSSNTDYSGQFVGGVIGYAYQYIEISNVNVFGKIKSNRVAGGIIGSLNDTSDATFGSIAKITNCKVNADISVFSIKNDPDAWLCAAGIVGQSSTGIDGYPDYGLYSDNCSYSGNIGADNPATSYKITQSFLGYFMAKGASEGVSNKTVIGNFSVSDDSMMVGYASSPVYNQIPFECYNNYNQTYPYDINVGPNHDKELVGGYFGKVIINGVEKPTIPAGGMNWFPHGGEEI